MDYRGVQLWGLIELSLSLLITSDYSLPRARAPVTSRHQNSISVSQSPAPVTPHWPQQWAAHYNCTPNNPSLAQVSSYHYQHNYNNTWPGCQQSPVFSPLRPGNTSWWEPPASVTAPQNIDSYQIWTFKRFEMLFDLMIILVSDLTNKNGLTLDTWTDNSSNSLISPTSIHYQF